MSQYLVPLIAACATWLNRNYGVRTSTILMTEAEAQTRQAAMIAAWLRYPTDLDAALVHLVGPGGAQQLDALVQPFTPSEQPWRTWVDEVVVSWAACVLLDANLAKAAVAAVVLTDHAAGLSLTFHSLLDPDHRFAPGMALLRHPDLLTPVANLHRADLLSRL
jgi:hypothetical protein